MPIVYTEHRRGEIVAVCETPDGSRAVIPAWMLDRVACATLSVGPPRCSLAALCDLRRLLDALGFDGRAPARRRGGQEDDHERIEDERPLADPAVATVLATRTHATTGRRDAGRSGPVAGAVARQRVGAVGGSRGTR